MTQAIVPEGIHYPQHLPALAHVHDDSKSTMSDTTPAMSHHDLVTRIAARAFDPHLFTIYTTTQRVLQRPVKGQYPHLVAVGNVAQRMEIVGMVETVEALKADHRCCRQ